MSKPKQFTRDDVRRVVKTETGQHGRIRPDSLASKSDAAVQRREAAQPTGNKKR